MGMSQGGGGQGSIFTEINITPLTDIFLVLLIIMMVIAPMFQEANQDIKVPKINSGQGVEENLVTVEITKEGQLYLRGAKVSSAELAVNLSTLATGLPEKHLVVRADQNTHSSEVLKVFEAAGQAGFEKLTIAGEPLSAERQEELKSLDNERPVRMEALPNE
jgi:biopolymer transport protein ExbD